MNRWIKSTLTQKRTTCPGPDGPEPELLPGQRHVPRPGHHPVQLDGATRPHRRRRLRRSPLGGGRARGGEGGRQPQLQLLPLSRRDRGEPFRRSDRELRVKGLMRPVGVVSADEPVHRRLRQLQRGKRAAVVEQLPAQGEVEPLDLPGRGRRRRLRHPAAAATSVTDAPANTARTASNRCSTFDKTTSTIPASLSHGAHERRFQDRPTTARVLSIS